MIDESVLEKFLEGKQDDSYPTGFHICGLEDPEEDSDCRCFESE
jgi:hypothetical protein